jgi:hypothetical protein
MMILYFVGILRREAGVLAVLGVKALVHINEDFELYSQVVAGYFVHLDPAFLYVIRTQASKNGVAPVM